MSGYSVRSGYIVRFEREAGLDPVVVTSAQHPGGGAAQEEIGGVSYRRTPAQSEDARPLLRELKLIRAMERSVDAAIRAWKPDVVHAHSPVLVGFPAMRAARKHGLPFVYEVRDLWENASVDRGKFKEGSALYRAARRTEGFVFQRADAVVTICQSLRDELAPRVEPHTALHVVSNGVEVARFKPAPPSDEVRARWRLGGKRVIGYLGAFQPWEGIPDLIAAMPAVAAAVPEAHLLITGGGDVEGELRAQVESSGLGHLVTFTGRVPHAEVDGLIALAELMVYPRILTRTTALTTPLKPLEAMAMERPVLVSDVPALLELVRPGETGMVFRAGDVGDLAAKCVRVLSDPALARAMGKAARGWIERERDWAGLIAGYRGIYEGAARAHAGAPRGGLRRVFS